MAQTTFYPTNSDDGYADSQIVTSYPPGYGSHNMTGTIANVTRDLSGANYHIAVCLLKWDTSSLPDDATVTGATLQFESLGGANVNSRNLTASWNSWNGTSADYTSTAETDALAGVTLANFTAAGIKNVPLDNVSGVSKTGTTYLKLHVSGGVPTSFNGIDIASNEHPTAQEPRLIVDYDDTPPTPGDPNQLVVGMARW